MADDLKISSNFHKYLFSKFLKRWRSFFISTIHCIVLENDSIYCLNCQKGDIRMTVPLSFTSFEVVEKNVPSWKSGWRKNSECVDWCVSKQNKVFLSKLTFILMKMTIGTQKKSLNKAFLTWIKLYLIKNRKKERSWMFLCWKVEKEWNDVIQIAKKEEWFLFQFYRLQKLNWDTCHTSSSIW